MNSSYLANSCITKSSFYIDFKEFITTFQAITFESTIDLASNLIIVSFLMQATINLELLGLAIQVIVHLFSVMIITVIAI